MKGWGGPVETMVQYFEWYVPEDGSLWGRLREDAGHLQSLGCTMVWMPPAYKGAAGRKDVGYGVYDLYDLGEFNAKGTVATKYGTKDAYISAVEAVRAAGMTAIADIVFNHRMGADLEELADGDVVHFNDRNAVQESVTSVPVWTGFSFPARNGKYSAFQWGVRDFSGSDLWRNGQHQILRFAGKSWSDNVSKEEGNYDFIMGADVDFHSRRVTRELYRWGRWYLAQVPVNGFRLDAVKSIDSGFFPGWLRSMRKVLGYDAFAVGEYWSGDLGQLEAYLKKAKYSMALFDVPLHFHLMDASRSNGNYDLRRIFDGTLSQVRPDLAVAFVDNHDTQPHQALESWVMDWFKPVAYALILLYRCKVPCVFYGDLYGIARDGIRPVAGLAEMMYIRKNILSEDLTDLPNDDGQMLAWMQGGRHPLVVVVTIADWKQVSVQYKELALAAFVDVTDPGHVVRLDKDGIGTFTCRPGSAGIYILQADYESMKRAL